MAIQDPELEKLHADRIAALKVEIRNFCLQLKCHLILGPGLDLYIWFLHLELFE